jgi:hypothetical protein
MQRFDNPDMSETGIPDAVITNTVDTDIIT